jgi:predicted ester cyclase
MAAASIDVPPALAEAWFALPMPVRAHVTAYLGTEPVATTVVADVPDCFADDLATGGRRLRAAFPALVRRLAAVDVAGDRVEIRIACEGTHDGAFFGLMTPTGRRVRFEERHVLAHAGDRVVVDRLELDLRAVVRQLGNRPRKQPRAAGGRRAVLASV